MGNVFRKLLSLLKASALRRKKKENNKTKLSMLKYPHVNSDLNHGKLPDSLLRSTLFQRNRERLDKTKLQLCLCVSYCDVNVAVGHLPVLAYRFLRSAANCLLSLNDNV